jgi:hypothetical protein
MVYSFQLRGAAILAAGLAAATLGAQVPGRFPQLQATSLSGRSLNLPADFGSPASLVFVAFQMKQQSEIDAWKPFVDGQRAKRAALKVWELPTINAGYKFMRGIIEGGMRSGIKSQDSRDSTVTLFLDSSAFAQGIGAAMDRIAVLVLAPDGRILGRAAGLPDATSESAVDSAISAAFATAK